PRVSGGADRLLRKPVVTIDLGRQGQRHRLCQLANAVAKGGVLRREIQVHSDWQLQYAVAVWKQDPGTSKARQSAVVATSSGCAGTGSPTSSAQGARSSLAPRPRSCFRTRSRGPRPPSW